VDSRIKEAQEAHLLNEYAERLTYAYFGDDEGITSPPEQDKAVDILKEFRSECIALLTAEPEPCVGLPGRYPKATRGEQDIGWRISPQFLHRVAHEAWHPKEDAPAYGDEEVEYILLKAEEILGAEPEPCEAFEESFNDTAWEAAHEIDISACQWDDSHFDEQKAADIIKEKMRPFIASQYAAKQMEELREELKAAQMEHETAHDLYNEAQAEVVRLIDVLKTIKYDAKITTDEYAKNGPQWTSKNTGEEYYSASYVLSGAYNLIEKIDIFLSTHPDKGDPSSRDDAEADIAIRELYDIAGKIENHGYFQTADGMRKALDRLAAKEGRHAGYR